MPAILCGPGITREHRYLLHVLRVPESAPGRKGPVFRSGEHLQEHGPALSGSEGVLVIGYHNPRFVVRVFFRRDGSKVELQLLYLIKLDYGWTIFFWNIVSNIRSGRLIQVNLNITLPCRPLPAIVSSNLRLKLTRRVPRPSGKLLQQVLHYSGGRPVQMIV